jgi:hypothetical protein
LLASSFGVKVFLNPKVGVWFWFGPTQGSSNCPMAILTPLFCTYTLFSWYNFLWRAPKSRGETHLRVSQSQVAESWDLVACSRLPTLKRGRGSSWEPRD